MNVKWIRMGNGGYRMEEAVTGVSIPFIIKRTPYGKTGLTFDVFFDGERLPLASFSRLKDAKKRAEMDFASMIRRFN